jgi:hypothetical protein
MIKAELEFEYSAARLVLEKLMTLPEAMRPTYKSLGEDDAGTKIGDAGMFVRNFELPSIGVFLKNSSVLYDIRRLRNGGLVCCGYFYEASPDAVKNFLINLASARPIFGFACTPEERDFRNRITTVQGVNTIESWVGRDTQKYIPGLYWLTLLPAELAEKHGVSLSRVTEAAREHIELEGKQHLFRFYEGPDDWRSADTVNELCSSVPGIFDIEKVRPLLRSTKTYLELSDITTNWR